MKKTDSDSLTILNISNNITYHYLELLIISQDFRIRVQASFPYKIHIIPF